MKTVTKASSVTYRLFTGFLLTAELKLYLHRSPLFKDEEIERKEDRLIEVPFEENVYLGKYLDESALSLDQLPKIEEDLKQELQRLCPDYPCEKSTLRFFSQAFIQ